MTKLKKKIYIVASTLCAMIMLLVGVSVLLPASFDAGACGGGFSTYIIEKELDKIQETVGKELSEKQITQISENITFDGRRMLSCYTNNDQGIVLLQAKRYWFEKYKWSVNLFTN